MFLVVPIFQPTWNCPPLGIPNLWINRQLTSEFLSHLDKMVVFSIWATRERQMWVASVTVCVCALPAGCWWRGFRMSAGTVVIAGGILATVILLTIIAVLCLCRLQVQLSSHQGAFQPFLFGSAKCYKKLWPVLLPRCHPTLVLLLQEGGVWKGGRGGTRVCRHVADPPPGSVRSPYAANSRSLQRWSRDLPSHLPHRGQRAGQLLPNTPTPAVPALACLLPILRSRLAAILPAAPRALVQRRPQDQLQDCAPRGPGTAHGPGELVPQAKSHPLRRREGQQQHQHRCVGACRHAGISPSFRLQRCCRSWRLLNGGCICSSFCRHLEFWPKIDHFVTVRRIAS